MKIAPFPFTITDWAGIAPEENKGHTGTTITQTFMMGDIRIRKVAYSAGYLADHWCSKGHIIYCIEGAMQTELEDGRIFNFSAGMTYHVGDNCEAHRSSSENGCQLLIVD
jgi:quercetin dioxygenase-like cupin family protein